MQVLSASENRATWLGFLAILLWSTTFGLARSLSEQLGPITSGAAVYFAAAAFSLPRLWLAGRSGKPFAGLTARYLVGCGSLFVLYGVAIYAAVGLAADRSQLLEVALINYLWPSGTVLFSLPLLGQRASGWLWPGVIAATAGVFVVMTPSGAISWESFARNLQANPWAHALALVAAMTWALYSNLTRRWSGAGGAVEWFVPATGLVLLVIRLFKPEQSIWTVKAIGEVLALGAFTALAYGCWETAMRKGNVLLVAVGSYFTPMLSTLVSAVYLGVRPAARLWLGCACLVLGSVMTWWAVRSRSAQPVAAKVVTLRRA